LSTFTHRCAAVTAALQDLARDLEADLGKLARWRGHVDGSSNPIAHLRDPGVDLDEFSQQRSEFSSRQGVTVGATLTAYRAAASTAQPMVHDPAPAGADLAARTAVFDLIEAIQAVENHDDAIALVATFTEE
jgi:hypothetical protein